MFRMSKEGDRITFEELCELEPGLLLLAEEARQYKDDPSRPWFCANEAWYINGLKRWLIQLVGWDSKHPDPAVHTEAAYEAAYGAIYGLLPNCRNCGCLKV